ncbi:MAG: LamG-like jellyroll fold domain-containing protein [Wenzhouxiangellaceae bacterium]
MCTALGSGALWAGDPVELAMHWAMEPWTSDTGVLETEVPGTSATLENFPEDGSEWIVGVLGRALVFDGVDRHAQHDAPLPRTQGTIGHWLRSTTAVGTRVALYESDFTGAASPDYNGFGSAGDALEIHTGLFDGDWYAVWQDGGVSTKREVRGGAVTVDEWTHVAVTWSIPGELRLYVNCELVDSVAMDAAFEGRTPTEHFVGKPSQFTGRHWTGAVDEVKVWTQEFNADGVGSHFCPDLRPETDIVLAQTPTAGDRFGDSAALDGDWLLVRSAGASAVAWYRRPDFADFQFHSSRPSDFSHSLSSGITTPKPLDVSGSLAAVANAGSVDVYDLTAPSTWNLATTLSGDLIENFGFAIAVSGDRVAVGAPASNGGSAFVFERDQGGPDAWGATFVDMPGSFDTDEFTGRLVDLDGDLLAVFRQSVSLTGTTDIVDLFRRGELDGVAGWAPEASFSHAGDSIVSLAVRDDRVAVGAVTPLFETEGGVVVRHRDQGGTDQWGVEHTFVASDRDVLDALGANIVWLDDKTLAAATATDEDHQAIYVFRVGGASLQRQRNILVPKTFDPVTEIRSGLGTSLTGTSGLVIAGAPLSGFNVVLAPDQPAFSGRLHVFVSPEIFADGFESEDP